MPYKDPANKTAHNKAYYSKWAKNNRAKVREAKDRYLAKGRDDRNGLPWTEKEIQAVEEWTGTVADLSQVLGRSIHAINMKKRKL